MNRQSRFFHRVTPGSFLNSPNFCEEVSAAAGDAPRYQSIHTSGPLLEESFKSAVHIFGTLSCLKAVDSETCYPDRDKSYLVH